MSPLSLFLPVQYLFLGPTVPCRSVRFLWPSQSDQSLARPPIKSHLPSRSSQCGLLLGGNLAGKRDGVGSTPTDGDLWVRLRCWWWWWCWWCCCCCCCPSTVIEILFWVNCESIRSICLDIRSYIRIASSIFRSCISTAVLYSFVSRVRDSAEGGGWSAEGDEEEEEGDGVEGDAPSPFALRWLLRRALR